IVALLKVFLRTKAKFCLTFLRPTASHRPYGKDKGQSQDDNSFHRSASSRTHVHHARHTIPPNIASETSPRRIFADDRMYRSNSNAKNSTTDLAASGPTDTWPIHTSGRNGIAMANSAISESSGVV